MLISYPPIVISSGLSMIRLQGQDYGSEGKLKAPALRIFYSLSLVQGLLDSESPEDYVSGARALNMLIDQEITKRWLIRSPRHRIQKLIDALGWRSPVDRETRGLSARIVAHLVADLNLSQFQGALECISSLLDISYHNTVDQEVLHLLSGSNRTRKNGNMQDNKQQVENGKPSSSIGTNEDLILQGLRILEKLAQNEHNCTQIYDTKGLLLKITAPFNCKEFTEDIRTSVPWLKVVEASLRVVARLMEAPGDTGVNVREQIARNSQAIDNLNEVLSLQVQGNDSSILELQTQATEVLAKLFSDESTTNIIFQKEKVESTNMSRDRIGTFTAAVLDTLLTDTWMEDYLTKVFDETMSRLVKDEQGPSTWEKLCPCLLEKKNKKRIKPFVDQKMKEAQETAIRHKEMAWQALAKLSIGNKNIFEVIKKVKECPSGKKEVTECGGVVHSLIEMIDRKIETTIECSIEALKTKIKIKTKTIRCRISAAEFLKNLCAHSKVNETFKKTMLRKILEELLCTNRKLESQAGGRSLRNCFRTTSNDKENPQAGGRSLRNCFRTTSNDEENPQAGGRSLRNCFRTTSNDEENPQTMPSQQSPRQPRSLYAEIRETWTISTSNNEEDPPSLGSLQQPEARMLQAALLSLYATIRAKWTNEADFANVVMDMVAGKDFVANLKVVIEENSYPTPACLAILKITCKMVILLMQQHDYLKEIFQKDYLEEIKEKNIIDAMSEAAETMAGLESCMLFSGVKHDCYGVPVEPLCSVLVEKAQKLCK
ncbi:hypothetical protein PVAP13_5KG143048 [Panicum virgatum]|uniref:Uncharacterized protein n=1 Tax=Panicum virgatum TaxID=38727 RepID=A0A8T0SC31_PANVG|nr:hypothetical protein PVAP13_5KG143048 [Panicum virgatum]